MKRVIDFVDRRVNLSDKVEVVMRLIEFQTEKICT